MQTGRCMCGAVTITADVGPMIRVCHCDMCRRLTGAGYMSIQTRQEDMTVTGPVRTYRSSDWAERGFCAECGSVLWYATVHDNWRSLSAGLFENAGGGTLSMEFYADRIPEGYCFAGDHSRLDTEETIARFTGEAP